MNIRKHKHTSLGRCVTSSQTKNETTMTKVTFLVYLLIRLFIQNTNKHFVAEFLWSEYKTYGISITTRMTMKSHLLKTLNCKNYLSFNIVFIPEKAAMSAVHSVKL